MSDRFTRILMLKKTVVFAGVATEDLDVVARELVEEQYFAGERVFDINDPSERVYVVENGKIGISIDPKTKTENFIAILGPGECFGEMSMFDGQPRSATAHVLEDSMLLGLCQVKLRALLVQYPELALGMLRGMSLRLRHANPRLM